MLKNSQEKFQIDCILGVWDSATYVPGTVQLPTNTELPWRAARSSRTRLTFYNDMASKVLDLEKDEQPIPLTGECTVKTLKQPAILVAEENSIG